MQNIAGGPDKQQQHSYCHQAFFVAGHRTEFRELLFDQFPATGNGIGLRFDGRAHNEKQGNRHQYRPWGGPDEPLAPGNGFTELVLNEV